MQFRESQQHINLDDYPQDFSPAHKRVLSARKIAPNEIRKPLTALLTVAEMKGALLAAELIYRHIEKQNKILIAGDYDADGATATALIIRVLRHLGATIDFIVPNRFSMGYGLSAAVVEAVIDKSPQLVVTVDNGITACDSVQRLREQGIDVIISDHHLPLDTLPNANVIVNPNANGCQFPSKAIAGVGVAFYLMLALRQVLQAKADKRLDDFNMASLLDLVALGTISDMVPMDYNNRVMVEQGLRRIRKRQCSLGILALAEVAGVSLATLNTMDVAYQITPRLNAAGRVSDMALGVDCLLTQEANLAMDYALELNDLNNERKAIENEMKSSAKAIIQRIDNQSASGYCLFDKDWHEGVIGILASRIKEEYKAPAIVFTEGDDYLKGSARSIKGIDIVDVLSEAKKQLPDDIISYGGHAMAAGVNISKSAFANFRSTILSIFATHLEKRVADDTVYTDGALLPYEFNVKNAEFLKTLETWGVGLSEPLFCNEFYLEHSRMVGINHTKFALIEKTSNLQLEAIAFNRHDVYQYLKPGHYTISYRLTVNEWQGVKKMSLLVSHINGSDK